MRVIQLEVTQAHIDKAIAEYNDSFSISMSCPVFQAIKGSGLVDTQFAVGYHSVEKPYAGGGEIGEVSPNAEILTRLFPDEWPSAEPTSFTLVLYDGED